MELCREAGVSFEAVARPDLSTVTGEDIRKVKPHSPILAYSLRSGDSTIRRQSHGADQCPRNGTGKYDKGVEETDRTGTGRLNSQIKDGRSCVTVVSPASPSASIVYSYSHKMIQSLSRSAPFDLYVNVFLFSCCSYRSHIALLNREQ